MKKSLFKSKLSSLWDIKHLLLISGLSLTPFLKAQSLQGIGPWAINGTAQTQSFNDVCIGFSVATNTIPDAKAEIKYKPCLYQQNGLVITSLGCDINDPVNPNFTLNYNIQTAVVKAVDPNAPDPPYVPATVSISPAFNITSFPVKLVNYNKKPLFWIRDENPVSGLPGSPSFITYNTKFIVLPDGSTGINTNNPRASLDVVQSGTGYNLEPTAVFSKLQQGTQTELYGGESGTVDAGVKGFRTKQVMIFNSLRLENYNRIVQDKDQAILFTDGLNTDGSNQNGALVIAPWASDYQSSSSVVGGIRIDQNGKVEVHGDLRATKLTVDARWWPDFVFAGDYRLMPLTDVKKYINTYKHLPNMPSSDSVIMKGQDMGELQKLQQQKIEELTLYSISLEEKLQAQELQLAEQKRKQEELEMKVNLLLNK